VVSSPQRIAINRSGALIIGELTNAPRVLAPTSTAGKANGNTLLEIDEFWRLFGVASGYRAPKLTNGPHTGPLHMRLPIDAQRLGEDWLAVVSGVFVDF
jgi:hypothetical protein